MEALSLEERFAVLAAYVLGERLPDFEPSAADVRAHRNAHDCGMIESRQALRRKIVADLLLRPSAGPRNDE
jgi:hypothetical protein